MTLNLKADPALIERYQEYHRAVWPEDLVGLRGTGMMKILLHSRRLFMYLEAPDGYDMERDFAEYMAHNRAREWDELTRAKTDSPV